MSAHRTKQHPLDDSDDMLKVNWFVLNPKKTIVIVLIIVSVLIIALAENTLSKYKHTTVSGIRGRGIERYIVLREHPPLSSTYVEPDDSYLKRTDSLVRKKYRIRIDKNGFIEPSERHVSPDKRIVFLGGSTTECWWVEEASRFPYLSGILLEEKLGLRINSYNGGVSGSNTLHDINVLINKVLPLDPDVVVLMEDINDLTVLLYEGNYWASRTRPQIVENKKATFFQLVNQIAYYFVPNLTVTTGDLISRFGTRGGGKDEFAALRGRRLTIDIKAIKQAFELNLQTFINICSARGITPVLMTQENRFAEIPDELISETVAKKLKNDFDIKYNDYKTAFESLNQSIREVAKRNRVLLIDLDREIPHTREYIYDLVHFNDTGSRRAAEVISKKLLPVLRQ